MNLTKVFEAVDIITGERAAPNKIKLDDGGQILDPSKLLNTSVVSTPNLA
jgi:hypothetical protein